MSNSKLVTYTNITKNKTVMSNKKNDTITIHCIVGQWTAKQGCDHFAKQGGQSSANYVVGKDGSIGLSVDEKDRAWTTGGKYTVNGETGSQNDRHAVTIEVASDTKPPYAITDAAYKALVKLVADIAKRNNMGTLKWKADKNLIGKPTQQNMTVHRWFAAKACPGDYLYNKMGQIAAEANAINAGTQSNGSDEAAAANYYVKTTAKSGLWYRETPNGTKLGLYPLGTQLHITKESGSWGYTGQGWISLDWIERIDKPMNEMEQALQWAKENGLMQGNENGDMMAKEPLTREQFATVLKRFVDKFIK